MPKYGFYTRRAASEGRCANCRTIRPLTHVLREPDLSGHAPNGVRASKWCGECIADLRQRVAAATARSKGNGGPGRIGARLPVYRPTG